MAKILRVLGFGAILILFLLSLPAKAQGPAGTWKVAGTWVGINGGIYFQQEWTLSDLSTDGTFTGTATGTGALPVGRWRGS